MGAPLKNPPVYFTVAQVRFNALLKLAEYLPSIQEAMRRAGFPDFVSHKSIALQIVMQDGQAVPTPLPQERFLFGTTDRTRNFLPTTAITLCWILMALSRGEKYFRQILCGASYRRFTK